MFEGPQGVFVAAVDFPLSRKFVLIPHAVAKLSLFGPQRSHLKLKLFSPRGSGKLVVESQPANGLWQSCASK